MNIAAGKILFSTPLLTDPNFDKVVIFLAEHNANGALGFVINRLFERTFNELIAYNQSVPFKLYEGGPVAKESLFFLHKRPDLIEGGMLVEDSIYLGGDFKQAVQFINNKTITEKEIKLFIGYCGWDDGELEAEVEEGSWLVADNTSATIFNADISSLWKNGFAKI